ncbi:hypothetical protein ES703_70410 [subsurface metagenome]
MLNKCLLIGLTLILLVSLGGVIGCEGAGESPSQVAKNFYAAINERNFDKASEYMLPAPVYPPQKPDVTHLDISVQLAGNIERIEIKGEETDKIRGTEVATVHITVVMKPTWQKPLIYGLRNWGEACIQKPYQSSAH